MAKQSSFAIKMRIIHRYLGFFLAGIMAVYALSGIVLIFRDTDFLKQKEVIVEKLEPDIPKEKLGKALDIRKLKVEKAVGDIYYFKDGTYNKVTGEASYIKKELPLILDKMTHLHKSNLLSIYLPDSHK